MNISKPSIEDIGKHYAGVFTSFCQTDLLQLVFESYFISAHYKVQKKSWHYSSCSLILEYDLVV
jgi:hypothetical protein